MSVAPPQPVIPYAEATSRTLDWCDTDEGGIELVVAPPDLWRQLVGPGAVLAMLTIAVPLGAALSLGIFLHAAGAAGAAMWWVFTVAMMGIWAMTVRTIWRVGRYGRLASVLRASGGILHVIVPSRPQEYHRVFAAAAMSQIAVVPRRGAVGLMPVIRVLIVFRGGTTTGLDVPWRGGEPIEPVERRVREVLGLPVQPQS